MSMLKAPGPLYTIRTERQLCSEQAVLTPAACVASVSCVGTGNSTAKSLLKVTGLGNVLCNDEWPKTELVGFSWVGRSPRAEHAASFFLPQVLHLLSE